MTRLVYALKLFISLVIGSLIFFTEGQAQKFIHPGIDQSSADLELMKQKVKQGAQPWAAAFERLKAAADTNFILRAHTHVLRGPYGRPNIGGDDLSRSANMAYNYALLWYITNNKSYASKAISILDTWSTTLWDFDYNDAKLLAAWTGHVLCNAAEILRYSNSGWSEKGIGSFTNMLMTVYYPLLRYYYPTANGNWDGAIIHSILAMAIFTDNRAMYENAVDHYLHAPVNGSIFKYIYPSGQCQESTRDQGHVQLGLGEFAGAAQIAFTQGTDLYSLANNRLALGYEYTAQFLMGKKPHCYGIISERAKNLRDDFESVYAHYTAMGVDMPYTKMAADSIRPRASRSILTSVRANTKPITKHIALKPSGIGYIAGAGASKNEAVPANAVYVDPGQSVQEAMNTAAGSGRWVVLRTGIHKFNETLKIPSGVTLSGEGIGSVLFLDPASASRDAIINMDSSLHDVTIRNLVIEAGTRTEPASDPNGTRSYRGGYNRGGIIFRALKKGQMKNIRLINISVLDATFNGVAISGATNIEIDGCDFSENGGSVVPGAKLQHNLLLTHCADIKITNSRLSTSAFGSGIALDHCSEVVIGSNEIARNAYHGIFVSESKAVEIKNNLIEANDFSGIMVEYLWNGSENISVAGNIVQYNNGFGIETYAVKDAKIGANTLTGNGRNKEQQELSAVRSIHIP
jgi:parallel beta-helix repeat protein